MARKKAQALPQPEPEMLTVYGDIIQETEDAILIACDGDEVWLPKSQIEYCGERGDEDVEITLPDWLAEDKGLTGGQGMRQAAAPAPPTDPTDASQAPPDLPEPPTTFTFKADVEHVYAEKYVLLVVNGEKTATLDFDKSDVSYEGQDVTELQEGYEGMTFTIPYALAVEKHLPEFLGVTTAPTQEPPADSDTEDDNAPQAAPYQKKLREETITVTVALDAAEREACGQRMADAIKRKESLEDQLDSYRKGINHQIKAVENEISAAADLWYEGQEERRVDCDVIADYNTGEIVWCEKEYPFKEVQRQRMTEKDRQLPLPIDTSPAHQGEATDMAGDTPAVTGTVILHGRLDKITEDDITITFTDNEGEEMQFTLPKAGVNYEDGLEIGDSADFTMPRALAVNEGIVDATEGDEGQSKCGVCKWSESEHCKDCFGEEMFEEAPERSCGSCAHLHSPHTEGEDDPCFDCGNAEDKPKWQEGLHSSPTDQGANAETIQ